MGGVRRRVDIDDEDLQDLKLHRIKKFRKIEKEESFWPEEESSTSESEEEDTAEDAKRLKDAAEKRVWMFQNSDKLTAMEEESHKNIFQNTQYLGLGKRTLEKIEKEVQSSSILVKKPKMDYEVNTEEIPIKNEENLQIEDDATVNVNNEVEPETEDNLELEDDNISFFRSISYPPAYFVELSSLPKQRGSFLNRAGSLPKKRLNETKARRKLLLFSVSPRVPSKEPVVKTGTPVVKNSPVKVTKSKPNVVSQPHQIPVPKSNSQSTDKQNTKKRKESILDYFKPI